MKEGLCSFFSMKNWFSHLLPFHALLILSLSLSMFYSHSFSLSFLYIFPVINEAHKKVLQQHPSFFPSFYFIFSPIIKKKEKLCWYKNKICIIILCDTHKIAYIIWITVIHIQHTQKYKKESSSKLIQQNIERKREK